MLIEGILDQKELFSRLDDDVELLQDLIELFMADYPQWMIKIKSAIDARDAKKLEEASHTLKGAVGNFCVEEAFKAASRLQVSGRKNDFSAIDKEWQALKTAMDKVEKALQVLAAQYTT